MRRYSRKEWQRRSSENPSTDGFLNEMKQWAGSIGPLFFTGKMFIFEAKYLLYG